MKYYVKGDPNLTGGGQLLIANQSKPSAGGCGCPRNSLVFLQIQERDGVSVAQEGIFRDVADVVGSQVEVTETMKWSQRVTGDLMQVVISQAEILKIFWSAIKKVVKKKRRGCFVAVLSVNCKGSDEKVFFRVFFHIY